MSDLAASTGDPKYTKMSFDLITEANDIDLKIKLAESYLGEERKSYDDLCNLVKNYYDC